MTTKAAEPNPNLKLFLQEAVPIFQGCKTALAKRDWMTLQQQSASLRKVAESAAQVMIEVQAQLLEQSALQGQLHRASYLLLRIKTGLSTMLSDMKADGSSGQGTLEAEPDAAAPEINENCKRLGNYLIEAELLTPAQLEVALADQKMTGSRLGEILATRGWIKQGTIEYLMQKVILPERQGPQQATPPEPPVAEKDKDKAKANQRAEQSQDVNSRSTLVDQSKSTYIY